MRTDLRLSIAVVGMLLIPSSGSANTNEQANKLFVKAFQEIEAAKNTEDFREKSRLWCSAKKKYRSIVSDHPGSNAAVQLLTGKIKPSISLVDEQCKKWRFEGQCVVAINRYFLDLKIVANKLEKTNSMSKINRISDLTRNRLNKLKKKFGTTDCYDIFHSNYVSIESLVRRAMDRLCCPAAKALLPAPLDGWSALPIGIKRIRRVVHGKKVGRQFQAVGRRYKTTSGNDLVEIYFNIGDDRNRIRLFDDGKGAKSKGITFLIIGNRKFLFKKAGEAYLYYTVVDGRIGVTMFAKSVSQAKAYISKIKFVDLARVK